MRGACVSLLFRLTDRRRSLSVFQLAATFGAFIDWPPCKLLVKTHAHRAAFCLFSLCLYIALCDDRHYFDAGDAVVVAFALIFFLGNVVASVVSCCQSDALHEKLVEQDIRTSAVDVAPSPAVAASSAPAAGTAAGAGAAGALHNSGVNAPAGVIVTSFNEV